MILAEAQTKPALKNYLNIWPFLPLRFFFYKYENHFLHRNLPFYHKLTPAAETHKVISTHSA